MLRSFKLSIGLSLPYVIAESKKDGEESLPPSISLKPSQIPIYDHDLFKIEYHAKEKGKLHEGISTVRKEVESLVQSTKETRDSILHIYETGKAHTLSSVDYILEEENLAARVGVITAGGLLGLLLATRKGFFRKILYTSVGAGAVASACYPKHAYEFSEVVAENAKTYGLVGYNFIVGAKPQSEQTPTIEKLSAPLQPIVKEPESAKAEPEDKATPTNAQEPKEESSLKSDPVAESPPPTKDSPPVQPSKNEVAAKDVIIKAAESVQQSIIGDYGQSSPDDRDMYTTRSDK